MSVDRRSEPARVLEADVRQHAERGPRSRWWRHSVRRARPRSPRPRTSLPAISHSAAAVSSSNCVTWSSSARVRLTRSAARDGPRDRRGEGFGVELALADLHPLAVGHEMRRGVCAGAQPVALRGSRRSCASSRTCRWCRERGSRRSAPAGEPSAVIIRRIRSRPKRMPNSSSDRSWRSARSSVQANALARARRSCRLRRPVGREGSSLGWCRTSATAPVAGRGCPRESR